MTNPKRKRIGVNKKNKHIFKHHIMEEAEVVDEVEDEEEWR